MSSDEESDKDYEEGMEDKEDEQVWENASFCHGGNVSLPGRKWRLGRGRSGRFAQEEGKEETAGERR